MPLLGKLIKKSIDVANEIFEEDKNPIEAQAEVLKNLLEKAKDTDFGKRYQFNEILKSEDLTKSFRVWREFPMLHGLVAPSILHLVLEQLGQKANVFPLQMK